MFQQCWKQVHRQHNNCGKHLDMHQHWSIRQATLYTMRHIPWSLRHNLANLLPYFLRICKKGGIMQNFLNENQANLLASFEISMLTIFFLLAVLLDIKHPPWDVLDHSLLHIPLTKILLFRHLYLKAEKVWINSSRKDMQKWKYSQKNQRIGKQNIRQGKNHNTH